MRRFITILILTVLSASCVFADDSSDDILDKSTNLQDEWSSQKVIPEGQFQQTIDKFTKKKKKKKRNDHEELMPSTTNEDMIQAPDTFKEQYTATLLIPLELVTGRNIIPAGYYKVVANKQPGGEFFFDLYQGANIAASIPAMPSEHDDNEESLNYVKLVPYDDNYIRIIYGTLDCNLEAFVRIYGN